MLKTEPNSGLIFGTGLGLEVRFWFFFKEPKPNGNQDPGFLRSETRSWIFLTREKGLAPRANGQLIAGFDPEIGPEPGVIFGTRTRICFEPLRTQDPGFFKNGPGF